MKLKPKSRPKFTIVTVLVTAIVVTGGIALAAAVFMILDAAFLPTLLSAAIAVFTTIGVVWALGEGAKMLAGALTRRRNGGGEHSPPVFASARHRNGARVKARVRAPQRNKH